MKIFIVTTKLNFKAAGGSMMEIDIIARVLQRFGNEVKVVTIFPQANDLEPKPPYEVVAHRVYSGRQLGLQKGILQVLKAHEQEADAYMVDGHIFLYGAGLYRRLG